MEGWASKESVILFDAQRAKRSRRIYGSIMLN